MNLVRGTVALLYPCRHGGLFRKLEVSHRPTRHRIPSKRHLLPRDEVFDRGEVFLPYQFREMLPLLARARRLYEVEPLSSGVLGPTCGLVIQALKSTVDF
jgi:hypothetical protein